MKKFLALFIFTLLTTFELQAQNITTATELLQTSWQKTGGAKWDSVQTLSQKGEILIATPMGDFGGTIALNFKYPGYQSMDLSLFIMGEVMDIRQVSTPTGGYMETPDGREENAKAIGEEFANDEATLLADTSLTLSLAEETLNEKAYYVVSATKEDKTGKRYYDKETFFCVKSISREGTVQEYADYKVVEGLTFAHKVSIQGGDAPTRTISYKTFEINPELAGNTFE